MQAEQRRTSELISGLAAALVALVDALDAKGALTLEEYRASLHRLWDEMPEEDAGSGQGFLFERLIDLLNDEIARRKR